MDVEKENSEKEFKVTCSDEELIAEFKETYTGWQPKPESILSMYEAIARDGILPLDWKCEFGRRSPTPSDQSTDQDQANVDEDKKIEIAGFDFDEEPTEIKFTPRRQLGGATPKGSAKKKTSNFDNILASVRRQQKFIVSDKSKTKSEKK